MPTTGGWEAAGCAGRSQCYGPARVARRWERATGVVSFLACVSHSRGAVGSDAIVRTIDFCQCSMAAAVRCCSSAAGPLRCIPSGRRILMMGASDAYCSRRFRRVGGVCLRCARPSQLQHIWTNGYPPSPFVGARAPSITFPLRSPSCSAVTRPSYVFLVLAASPSCLIVLRLRLLCRSSVRFLCV
ncbi:hypothetical protein BV20DRAFT_307004 [Pilatotrama ljubarskyi]|nr:hypothetical protein BV20DRAFT_307004 [Pilatotrama ljubarskyi]